MPSSHKLSVKSKRQLSRDQSQRQRCALSTGKTESKHRPTSVTGATRYKKKLGIGEAGQDQHVSAWGIRAPSERQAGQISSPSVRAVTRHSEILRSGERGMMTALVAHGSWLMAWCLPSQANGRCGCALFWVHIPTYCTPAHTLT